MGHRHGDDWQCGRISEGAAIGSSTNIGEQAVQIEVEQEQGVQEVNDRNEDDTKTDTDTRVRG